MISQPKNLPTCAGVYFFKDAEQNILYIGKAKNLKNRISSYFNNTDLHVLELLKKADHIDFITTNHEVEALFLEAQLIKQNQPVFNRLLKAGNPFIYIFFSKQEEKSTKIPTISIVRLKKKKGDYFGPFLTKKDAQMVVEYLKKSLQLNICNKKIDTGCLQYHINICSGSCKKDFDLPFYLMRLQIARQILSNDYKQAIKNLDQEIAISNKNLQFERSAHLVRYQQHLLALSSILQTLQTTKYTNIKQAPLQTQTAVEQERQDKNLPILFEIKNRLGLKKVPYTIDCFDISHMQSQSIVGSCVRFLDGKPDKKKFRHFNVTSIVEQNDYAALSEIVSRRYKKIEDFPDLIMIDGGKGQLNATKNLAGNAEIISIAKGEGRKPGLETIFFPNTDKTIDLDIHQPADRLLIQIRDYAHHFAIEFHRKKQKINNF
ncbi:MAG: GIY-YIG nuclease family protein [Candidatus Chromulinivorax sp.]